MSQRQLGVTLALWIVACLAVIASGDSAGTAAPAAAPTTQAADAVPGQPVDVVLPLKGPAHRVQLEQTPQGVRLIEHGPGGDTILTPDQFFTRVYEEQLSLQRRSWLLRVCNISGLGEVGWVSLGFMGQALFLYRMLLQWITSERAKKSVVPVGFWWCSLIGGLMLLTYVIWRRDIVMTIGQSTGAIVYTRNLILIYRKPEHPPSMGEDPAPEPELLK